MNPRCDQRARLKSFLVLYFLLKLDGLHLCPSLINLCLQNFSCDQFVSVQWPWDLWASAFLIQNVWSEAGNSKHKHLDASSTTQIIQAQREQTWVWVRCMYTFGFSLVSYFFCFQNLTKAFIISRPRSHSLRDSFLFASSFQHHAQSPLAASPHPHYIYLSIILSFLLIAFLLFLSVWRSFLFSNIFFALTLQMLNV